MNLTGEVVLNSCGKYTLRLRKLIFNLIMALRNEGLFL